MLTASSTNQADAQARATVALAVIRSLMLDENATQEHARIDAALAAFGSSATRRLEENDKLDAETGQR